MNAKDKARLTKLTQQVNTLLNQPANARSNNILNIDVLEAFLGDVQAAAHGRQPTEIAKLIKRDQEG